MLVCAVLEWCLRLRRIIQLLSEWNSCRVNLDGLDGALVIYLALGSMHLCLPRFVHIPHLFTPSFTHFLFFLLSFRIFVLALFSHGAPLLPPVLFSSSYVYISLYFTSVVYFSFCLVFSKLLTANRLLSIVWLSLARRTIITCRNKRRGCHKCSTFVLVTSASWPIFCFGKKNSYTQAITVMLFFYPSFHDVLKFVQKRHLPIGRVQSDVLDQFLQ